MSNIPEQDLDRINREIGLQTSDKREARFYEHQAIDMDRSSPGNIVYKAVDFVEIWHKGEKGETKSKPVTEEHKQRFATEWAAYEAEKNGNSNDQRSHVSTPTSGLNHSAPSTSWETGNWGGSFKITYN